MTDEQLKKLEASGFDIAGAMERFLENREMYERFLHKFQHETNFAVLTECIHSGDVSGAFAAAHTLKGVSANLSLQVLYHLISVQVEYLRDGNLSPAADMMPEVTDAYTKTQKIITDTLGTV